jgi:cholesterol oxidase
MERIAKPLDRMLDRYDAIVIGSGYGGAPVVKRIARSGRTVCLLERGREFHPGDFPRTFAEVASTARWPGARGCSTSSPVPAGTCRGAAWAAAR